MRTTDGGARFVSIPAPHAPYFFLPEVPPSKYATTAVSELRFADALDGFAYGGGLYVTHNAGSSWNRVSLGGSVTDLSIGEGYAYAVVISSVGQGRLMRSPVAREDWVTLPAAGHNVDGLSVHGTDVFVEHWNDASLLLVSHNRGASFTSYRAPRGVLGCEYEEPQAPVVWARCGTGTQAEIFRSTNGGQSFQPARLGYGQGIPHGAAFAPATATIAAVADNRIYRTGNGGASWTAVGPVGFLWPYPGFTNATHGAALAEPSSYCHPPKTIVAYEFSTNKPFPASQRVWKELATTLSWQGATLKPGATTTATFKAANPPVRLVGVDC